MRRWRLLSLERRIYHAGLEQRWYHFLQELDVIHRRLDAGAEPMDDATLRAMAREATASGRDPGDVLAELLEARASSTERAS